MCSFIILYPGSRLERANRCKETARCGRVLRVIKLFNIVVNDFDAKESACCRRVIVETELVVSGTQCSVGMGRLMDSVMAALGLKPSDRVQISSSAPERSAENKTPQQKPEDEPLSPEMEKLIEEIENRPRNRLFRGVSVFPFGSTPPSGEPPNDKKEKQEIDATNVDKIVPDVEKKEETEKEDCLGCKVVRVGGCAFAAGYVLYHITANTMKAKRLELLRIRIGGIGVIISKYINWSIFTDRVRNGY